MKKIIFKLTIIISLLIIINSCNQNINMDEIKNKIEILKQEYAPDKRVAIFEISAQAENGEIILEGKTNIEEVVIKLTEELKVMGKKVKNNIKLLPSQELGEKIYGIVNISVANIRSKPKHPAELATQALLGTSVNLLEKKNSWYLVQTPDQYISWVDNDAIYLVDENELNEWKKAKKVFVNSMFSSVYSKPNQKSQIISDVVEGNILKLISNENGYFKIAFPDGRIGYIKTNDAKIYSEWLSNAIATGKNIYSTSKQFMGIPYLWGGTSTKGVDCSGFTKTVYYLNGVVLPRDASQQVHVGELVDIKENFENLKPADLLFFGRRVKDNIKEKVTHVAIYLGNNKYIHSSGRVRINSLSKDDDDFNRYRFNTLLRAKRIIGNFDKGNNLVKNNNFYN